ncbi:hypothetical protein [Modestobacter sp. SSW1-42]|uniref:hypothetical protein n=1 Tax=Modestobacter sp. SSW1-42 TaxID=596372 RepID=UPI003986F89D
MSFVLGATWLALSIWATDHAALLGLALAMTIVPRTSAPRSCGVPAHRHDLPAHTLLHG